VRCRLEISLSDTSELTVPVMFGEGELKNGPGWESADRAFEPASSRK
jgi:hypothetical protein